MLLMNVEGMQRHATRDGSVAPRLRAKVSGAPAPKPSPAAIGVNAVARSGLNQRKWGDGGATYRDLCAVLAGLGSWDAIWREFGEVVEIRIRSCARFEQVWDPWTPFDASLGSWWRFVHGAVRGLSRCGVLGRPVARVWGGDGDSFTELCAV